MIETIRDPDGMLHSEYLLPVIVQFRMPGIMGLVRKVSF